MLIKGNSISQRPASANESDVYIALDTGARSVFAENAWHDLPWGGTNIPKATTATYGTVKQAANVPAAAGATPTAAEFKALLDALKAAGIVAPDPVAVHKSSKAKA